MFNSSLNNSELIESYKNGSNWYRIYSDGWIEQGGKITGINNNTMTINLLKPMLNSVYYKNVYPKTSTDTGDASNMGAARAAGCYVSETTTSFSFSIQVNQGEAYWCAFGQGA